MLKLFQIGILFILFVPIAAAEIKIFSGKIITDTDTEIDDVIFRFSYSTGDDKMFVATPSENLIVENGGCKSGRIFRVCVNSVNFSYKNVTTYVYYYESDLDVYKLTGSLEATAISTLAEMLQGETATVTLTIRNPTEFGVIRINFSEDFAPFEVKDADGCVLSETKLTWYGSLNSTYEQVCTAKIVAKNEGKFSFIGNLNYFNGFETEAKKTAQSTITVLPKQLKTSIVSDKEVEVGQQFFVNFTLKNLHQNEDIKASLQFELPRDLELIENISGFTKESNILKHDTKIGSNGEQYYSFHLRALSAGNASIKHKFSYTIKNIDDVVENETAIIIKESKLLATSSTELANTSTNTNISSSATKQNEVSKEIPKERFNLKSAKFIILPILSLIVFVLIMILINRIKKRKQEKNPLYHEALKEIQEKVLK